MFARTQDQPVREAASLNGMACLSGNTASWCPGAKRLAYRQVASTTVIRSSKQFAHRGGSSFGFGLRASVPAIRLAKRLGNPEDRL
jgi:hypothetical protein